MIMKANELRVGNLILWKGIEVKIVDVAIISRADNDPEGFNMNYKPIPLTEEWLLNFGFSIENGDYYNDDVSIKQLLFEPDNERYFHFNGSRAFIYYVHQLQNLFFALKGKELILKE